MGQDPTVPSRPPSSPHAVDNPSSSPRAHPRGIWAPLPAGSQDDGKVIHINRVQHQAVRVGLGEPVALPCLFLLQPSASLGPNEPPDPPRVKWSKVRSATGQREDVPILVAKDNAVKVVKAYEGRVSLPGYPRDRYNATLLLRAARASDAGLYRCEVVAGIDDEQDLLPLEVTGEWRGSVLRAWGCLCEPCTPCEPCTLREPCALCEPCTLRPLCKPRKPCTPCKLYAPYKPCNPHLYPVPSVLLV